MQILTVIICGNLCYLWAKTNHKSHKAFKHLDEDGILPKNKFI